MSTADNSEPETIAEILRGRLTVPVAEAAKLLGIGLTTLYDGIRRGDIPNAGMDAKGRTKRVPTWWLIERLSPPKAP